MSIINIAYTNSNIYLAEIKSRTDLVEIVGETVSLSRKGNKFWGLCPFHAEKTASFSVSREKGRFYCFGCHASGDVFEFVMMRDRLDFRQARDCLAARAGLRVEVSTADRRAMRKAREKRETEQRRQELARKLVRDEWKRLIEIEQWCHLFLKHVRTPRDMERPGPAWAAHTISRVESILDDLERADDTEKFRIALEVRTWRP